jgi:rhodanese-related sulfurtransferase
LSVRPPIRDFGWYNAALFTIATRLFMDQYLEFAANHTILMAALVFSFFLLVFTELRRKASGVVSVEPQDAVKLINNDAMVIDLRSPEAFARGHIVNARNIPLDELDAKHEKLEAHRAKPLIAVCESGTSSTRAVDKLRKSGFESVYGLKGGITGWTQANLPLVTSKKTRKKS